MNLSENSLILIIDDSQFARDALRESLTASNFRRFVEAAHGQDALEVLRRQWDQGQPVELVTCDVNMPVMSGIEFLRKLRTLNEFKTLPVMMVTVESEMPLIREALMLGAVDYIVKPFSTPVIVQKVERLCRELSKTA